MSEIKDMLRNTLAAMTEELATAHMFEDAPKNVFITDTVEKILFEMKPNTVLSVNSPEAMAAVPEAVLNMCYLCTGHGVLMDGVKSEYMEAHTVTSEVIQTYVDELITAGVIPQEAAVYVFNETAGNFKGQMGGHAGVLMRHYPSPSENVHPFIAAGVDYNHIPGLIKKNCAEQWEFLDKSEQARFGTAEVYTKVVYCSANDQLNRAIVSLKNGGHSASITLYHPCTEALPDRTAREQPLFDRVSAFDYLRSLTLWVDPETKKLRLQVLLRVTDVKTIYHSVLPMFSFFLSKIADETGHLPEVLELVCERFYMETNTETCAILKSLLVDAPFVESAIPGFVPEKSMIDFEPEDFIQGEKPTSIIL